MIDIQKKKVVAMEKKLSTILKSECLEVTMRHKNLLKAERTKDGKSFVLFKVESSVLIPKINDLIKLGLFWGVTRVLGCVENSYAELTTPDNSITLSCMMESSTYLTETHLAAIISKLVKSKDKMLQQGLNDIRILPELVFIEKGGKVNIAAIDAKKDSEVFGDIVAVFNSLIRQRSANPEMEDGIMSKSLLDLISFVDRLSKLNHVGGLDSLHPKHKEIWEKVAKHPFINLKFKRQILAELFQSTMETLERQEGRVGTLPFNPVQTHSIMIDRICWKSDQTGVAVRKNLGETSDSSGSSSSRVNISKQTGLENVTKGSQEWKSEMDKIKSQVFVDSSRTVIENFIQKTRNETSSSFLVNALENLFQTIVACEEMYPNKTEQMIRGLVHAKESQTGNVG